MSTMDTFNNNFNAPGDPPKCLQSVAESFRAQDRAHLAAWSELRSILPTPATSRMLWDVIQAQL